MVHTNQFRARVGLRIADNYVCTNSGSAPTKSQFRATVRIADNRGDTTRRGATCHRPLKSRGQHTQPR